MHALMLRMFEGFGILVSLVSHKDPRNLSLIKTPRNLERIRGGMKLKMEPNNPEP